MKIDKSVAVIIFLYSLSYLLVAINNGVFWDDYTLYNVERHAVIATFIEIGGGWAGPLHAGILSLGTTGIHIYRASSFVLYLLVVLFCYGVLKNVQYVDAQSRFGILLLFALIPVNSARVALINLPSIICYASFWAAFYLLAKGHRRYRLFSYILFFFSFFLNSLLVFYLVVILYHYFVAEKKSVSAKALISYTKNNYLFILLPFVFWIIRNAAFKGKNLYENYNVIKVDSLLEAFPKSFLNIYDSVFLVVKESFTVLGHWYFIPLFLFLCVFIFGFAKKIPREDAPLKQDILLFAFGVFVFALSVFPYLAVSKVPQLTDWQSRHQILTPLGSAFFLFYLIKVLQRTTRANQLVTISIVAVLVSVFVCKNLSNGTMFLQDWYKQQSIVTNMANDEVVKECSVVLIEDNTKQLNANDRNYRFYEYSGLMKMAFVDESRFGVDFERFRGMGYYRKFFEKGYAERYSLSDFKGEKRMCAVKLSMIVRPAEASLASLMLMDFFDQEKFNHHIKNFVHYESSFSVVMK